MLHALDPHSNFIKSTEYIEMMRKQQAHYYGVGMQITVDGPKVVVMEPFPGSPAWQADLRRGDAFATVDGHDTTGMDTGAVADLLRGPKGSQVRITVQREGASEPISATVTRGEIQTSVVDAFWLRPGTAYLNVSSFEAQNVGRDVEALLQKLGEPSVTGMILDLRGNPGGLVNEAVALAGRYLHDGQVVVSHRGRAEQEQVFRAKAQPSAQRYPIVVLVDRRSASASEIVSGALQDHDRAMVVGVGSFGKGLVQSVYPLSEGTGLALTTALYYTPSGRSIQKPLDSSQFALAAATAHPNGTSEFHTDAGRKVTGGGGIVPDYLVEPPAETRLRAVLDASGSFTTFATGYVADHKIAEDFEVTPALLDDFRVFLSQRDIQPAVGEWSIEREFITNRLKTEIFNLTLGVEKGDEVEAQRDPQILKALEILH